MVSVLVSRRSSYGHRDIFSSSSKTTFNLQKILLHFLQKGDAGVSIKFEVGSQFE